IRRQRERDTKSSGRESLRLRYISTRHLSRKCEKDKSTRQQRELSYACRSHGATIHTRSRRISLTGVRLTDSGRRKSAGLFCGPSTPDPPLQRRRSVQI